MSSSSSGFGRAPRLLLATALLGPLCLRCTSPTSKDPLVRFETCEELQVFLEDRLLHPEQVRGGGDVIVGCSADEAISRVDSDAPGSGGDDGRTFTTTNTQEVDVDEPDFIKNDGEHIFVLRRGQMIIVDAWPPTEAHIVSETPIEGVPFTMFFDGGTRAMVFARLPEFPPRLQVSLFDVTDRTAPVLRRTVQIDADYLDARRVGDDVVVVSRSSVRADVGLRREPFRDDENRAALRAAGIDGLLPRIHDDVIGNGLQVAPAVDCENTFAPRHTSSTDLLLANTISITDEQKPVQNTSVVGAPGSIYASTENLYLIGAEVYDGGHFTPDFAVTRIHKLGAFSDGHAPYLGSIALEGLVKDELSVDEDEASGTLRVVLTHNDAGNGDPLANSSALVVLEEGSDQDLVEIARVNDIGNGEVVESVRFLGDRAYVVTFPSTAEEFAFDERGLPRIPFLDPLFVIDLHDPRAPLLRGQLEVAGYSAYIHPLDEDHLLTVGVDVGENGGFEGLQLSIFDVSDLDAPALLHRTSFGDENSGSEALVERHAFTYFPELKTLALPYQHLGFDVVDQTALVVFSVDVDSGFGLRGLLDQLPLYVESLEAFNASAAPCGAVRRSVLMNDPELGAWVYAVSTAGISIAPLVDGLGPVTTVAFRSAELCDFSGAPL